MRENGAAVFATSHGQPEGEEGPRRRENVREIVSELREDILREVSSLLNTESLLERLTATDKHNSKSPSYKDSNGKEENKKDRKRDENVLYGKKFIERESELTTLMRINHIATIYNVFVATLISLFLSTVIHDIINTGSINLGFQLLTWNFSQFHLTALIWLEMMALVFGLYYGYVVWAKFRSVLAPTDNLRAFLDKSGMVVLIVFFVLLLCLPCAQVRYLNMPFACSMTVLCEQVRLLMKVYAFTRTNIPRTIQHTATQHHPYFVPHIQKYVYFLFAPTLLYRDDYPRTKTVRWGYAAARFTEVLCIMLYLSFLSERYMLPRVRDFGKPGTSFVHIVAIIIDNSVPSVVVIVCLFYSVLHAWLNGMAELLRFADRMFYKDWWNTTVYSEYYKTWNIVVYDWLYTFIYKDAGSVLFNSRYARAILVIAVSALFHEYIMAVGLGYLIPAFIVIYGFGGPMVMQLSTGNAMVGNVWIWFTLCLGSGMMVTLYLTEYFARVNCPSITSSAVFDFFIPRMVTCFE